MSIEYKLYHASAMKPERIEGGMGNMLNDGWEPLGSPVFHNGEFIQPLVKREESKAAPKKAKSSVKEVS